MGRSCFIAMATASSFPQRKSRARQRHLHSGGADGLCDERRQGAGRNHLQEAGRTRRRPYRQRRRSEREKPSSANCDSTGRSSSSLRCDEKLPAKILIPDAPSEHKDKIVEVEITRFPTAAALAGRKDRRRHRISGRSQCRNAGHHQEIWLADTVSERSGGRSGAAPRCASRKRSG